MPLPPRATRSRDPARSAGDALASAVEEVLASRERARLAIPGGSALAALGPARERLGDRWRRVALTWVDERCVPEADPDSNRGAARRQGLLDAPDPADRLPLYEDGESPAQAVTRTGARLREDFGGALDVLLLGLGEDGHVASLFPSLGPGFGVPEARLVAHVAHSPKPPADRITVTPALLATAERSVLLATGEGKRAALARLLAGDPRLPAHGLRGLHIFTDLELPRECSG